jgi:hypothetical protein
MMRISKKGPGRTSRHKRLEANRSGPLKMAHEGDDPSRVPILGVTGRGTDRWRRLARFDSHAHPYASRATAAHVSGLTAHRPA